VSFAAALNALARFWEAARRAVTGAPLSTDRESGRAANPCPITNCHFFLLTLGFPVAICAAPIGGLRPPYNHGAPVASGMAIVSRGQSVDPSRPSESAQSPPASAVAPNATADGSVRDALREGSYPWYDPKTDRLRPVWNRRRAWLRSFRDWLDRKFKSIDKVFSRPRDGSGKQGFEGDVIGTALLVSLLVALFITLVVLWARRESMGLLRAAEPDRLGTLPWLGELPHGIRPDCEDPWAEAQRRRAAGDLGGAIICVFAHQLLSLDQLGLIRLGPGRTGRQYIQLLQDHDLLDPVRSTLNLFEEVYYGRRSPTFVEFDAVWRRAQAFEERRSLLGATR
jgi:hypothetical protein